MTVVVSLVVNATTTSFERFRCFSKVAEGRRRGGGGGEAQKNNGGVRVALTPPCYA